MNDYYNARGYMLDGQQFLDRGSAAEYLVHQQFMEATEAESYLRNLVRQFRQRTMPC